MEFENHKDGARNLEGVRVRKIRHQLQPHKSTMMARFCGSIAVLSAVLLGPLEAWSPSAVAQGRRTASLAATSESSRREILTSGVVGITASVLLGPQHSVAEEEGGEEGFSSIAARAAKISKEVEVKEETAKIAAAKSSDTRSAFDFTVPVAGEEVSFKDLVRQEYREDGTAKVKAILVVNIKQDDPIARKNIPEFISLAAKYGSKGEFVVVLSPTDQGYFEPDTSALIRLKLASEYGYGINPVTTLTDKVNLLGTGAHPFWRWLEGTCRNPAGLGRIEANFEKFLLDGRTGMPLRRYPRKFEPFAMKDDIEAVIAGKPLPPVGAKFLEDWRQAAQDAERDTYRFQKGLNVFDQ